MTGDVPPPRLATGDPLRGLALLGIVTVHVATGAVFVTGHLAGAGGTLRPEEAFTPLGEWVLRALPVSVYLFFALSGFLITRPFVENFVQGRPLPALAPYLRNRALRLFPAAWVLLLFVCLRYGTRDAALGDLVSAFTLTESYAPHPLESLTGQMWSLKVELGFYLLVPLAFLAIWRLAVRGTARARRRAIYALAALGSTVSLVFSALASDSVVAQRSLAWALIAFMSGLALAAALAGRRPLWEGRRARVMAAAAFFAGLVIALWAGHTGGSSPWLTNLLATLSVCGLLWGPVMLETGGGGTWRWLTNPVLSWIGARSYALFLWHVVVMSEVYPLVRGIEGYRVTLVVLLPLVLAGSALVAELSWRLVESPALRLRARRRQPRPRPARAAEGSPATAVAGGPLP
jgi:peptidoglycan/LPS O-acetylase OafA/YrhL